MHENQASSVEILLKAEHGGASFSPSTLEAEF